MEARSPAGAAAPARYYRPELDILRFFAFMLVFVSHTTPTDSEYWANLPIFGPLATLFNAAALGGAFGVDLFFALSSFLITTLLLKEREAEGRIDVGAFYLRRLLRIWPLYFAFLLLKGTRTSLSQARLRQRSLAPVTSTGVTKIEVKRERIDRSWRDTRLRHTALPGEPQAGAPAPTRGPDHMALKLADPGALSSGSRPSPGRAEG